MLEHTNGIVRSAVFITFSGNCKKALTFYQSCFGGILELEPFGIELPAYKESPIVSGRLQADRITIHGSDLVHNEGRILGNYISIFISCKGRQERGKLIEKLTSDKKYLYNSNYNEQELIELKDAFEVHWVLGVSDH